MLHIKVLSMKGQYFHFINEYVENMLWNYAYLNPGMTINYNGNKFHSEKGLHDLLENKISGEILYPILHIILDISNITCKTLLIHKGTLVTLGFSCMIV